jgi:hypothetical protein
VADRVAVVEVGADLHSLVAQGTHHQQHPALKERAGVQARGLGLILAAAEAAAQTLQQEPVEMVVVQQVVLEETGQ